MDAPSPTTVDLSTMPPVVLLFDGTCAVCDAGMRWVMDRDLAGRVHYAPLHGPTAAAVLARHPELPETLDSLVWVEQTPDGERVLVHSDSIVWMLKVLPGAWPAVGTALSWVPRPLRDTGYRLFAAVRYRVFGRVDACRLPSESEAARMLP